MPHKLHRCTIFCHGLLSDMQVIGNYQKKKPAQWTSDTHVKPKNKIKEKDNKII